MIMAVDCRSEQLKRVHAQYPDIAVSPDFASILTNDDVDGVIIATPASTHFELARTALNAGKHVLVEKPLATTPAQCQELNGIAQDRNRVLMVGHTFEYHPAINFMRQIIRSGALGTVYYINSRRLNLGLFQPDVNVLWDLAPHDFSIVFSLIGETPASIDAWGCAHVLPDVEDVVYSKMEFNSGATAHLHVSWLDPVKVRQVTVVGSEGMLVFDDVQPSEKVRMYDKRFRPVVVGDSYADFQSAYHHGDVHIPSISNAEALKLEVLDFVNAIATGKQPISDGQSGLRVVEALEAASKCLHVRKHHGDDSRSPQRLSNGRSQHWHPRDKGGAPKKLASACLT
jgi:predicted dehydrogenase